MTETTPTFDLGANDVDFLAVGGGGPQEADPVAVAYPATVGLRDLVVTTESVADLEQREKVKLTWLSTT